MRKNGYKLLFLHNLPLQTEAGFNALRDDFNMTRSQVLMMSDTNKKEILATNVTTALTRVCNKVFYFALPDLNTFLRFYLFLRSDSILKVMPLFMETTVPFLL